MGYYTPSNLFNLDKKGEKRALNKPEIKLKLKQKYRFLPSV